MTLWKKIPESTRHEKYVKDADLILYVVDASTNLDENDGEIMERFMEDARSYF